LKHGLERDADAVGERLLRHLLVVDAQPTDEIRPLFSLNDMARM
jgi:hypothetical protein